MTSDECFTLTTFVTRTNECCDYYESGSTNERCDHVECFDSKECCDPNEC